MVLGVLATRFILSLPLHQEGNPKPVYAESQSPDILYHSIAGVIPWLAICLGPQRQGHGVRDSWRSATESV